MNFQLILVISIIFKSGDPGIFTQGAEILNVPLWAGPEKTIAAPEYFESATDNIGKVIAVLNGGDPDSVDGMKDAVGSLLKMVEVDPKYAGYALGIGYTLWVANQVHRQLGEAHEILVNGQIILEESKALLPLIEKGMDNLNSSADELEQLSNAHLAKPLDEQLKYIMEDKVCTYIGKLKLQIKRIGYLKVRVIDEQTTIGQMVEAQKGVALKSVGGAFLSGLQLWYFFNTAHPVLLVFHAGAIGYFTVQAYRSYCMATDGNALLERLVKKLNAIILLEASLDDMKEIAKRGRRIFRADCGPDEL